MTSRQRVLTYVAAALAFVVLGWSALAFAVYCLGGVATVSVVDHNEGFRFKAPVPMAIVHAAAATVGSTRHFSLEDLELDFEGDLGELGEVADVAVAILEVLDEAPNGTTFVSVDDGDERVRVSKSRGKFRVEVDSPDVTVKVAVPIRSVRRTVQAFVD